MNDGQRQSEINRREAAQAAAGSPVEGQPREVAGREVKQMLSVRIEPELIRALRRIAQDRGESVSDLLRAAAANLVAHESRQQVQFHMQPIGVSPSPSGTRTRITVHYWNGEDVKSQPLFADTA